MRDKNLSVISSLSAQPDSPREAVSNHETVSNCGSTNPSTLRGGGAKLASTTLDGGTHHQTTPISHVTSPSIHMALEDHQNQLKTLADQVNSEVIAWCDGVSLCLLLVLIITWPT